MGRNGLLGWWAMLRAGALVAMLLGLVADFGQPARAQGGDGLKVVATNTIIADMVSNVVGDCGCVTVTTLVPRGGDSHTYEPTPRDADALASADIVFENGLGLEPWLNDVFSASGSSAQRAVVTNAISPLRIADEPGADRDQLAEDSTGTPAAANTRNPRGASEGEYDPHVWFDVQNAKKMVTAIESALVSADAAHADLFHTDAAAYQQQLDQLDAFVVQTVGQLAPDQRQLVTSHDTFGYFAPRYGFTIIGTALGSVTTETADPSASDIAKLVDEIKASGVKAIFPENVSNPELLDQIAKEANVSVGPALYTDALGDPGSDGDTYIKMITYDVTQLVNALKG